MSSSSVGGIMLAPSKEEMMNALVLYDSQYGDTQRIAQAIANALGDFREARAVRLDPAQPVELQGLDLFIVGCPTQGWRPTPAIQSFLQEPSSEELGGLAVACFDTRFRLPRFMTGSVAKVMAAKLREKGVSLLAEPESFFVKGTEGPLRDGELDRAVAWARMLVKEVDAPSPEARQ
jgi:flavodoxin